MGSIHRSAWKGNSAKFALCALCEVGLSLLLGVCGLFFLDYLQALDHLEGEAHYAALLTLVLEVDGLFVIVDEDLRHKPAVVVESLRPLRDILVLYLFGLLAHWRLLLPSIMFLYPEEAPCIPLRGKLCAFIHRSAWNRNSPKFIFTEFYEVRMLVFGVIG